MTVPALMTTVWTTMITTQNVHASAFCGRPAISVLTRIEVTAMPRRRAATGAGRGVEEAGDHEDEEQRLAEHQDRREDEQPDEEHDEPEPMVRRGSGSRVYPT